VGRKQCKVVIVLWIGSIFEDYKHAKLCVDDSWCVAVINTVLTLSIFRI